MSGVTVTLVFEAGPEAGKSFKLSSPTTTIGRRKGEILIKDAEISGQHSQILVNGAKVSGKDMESTNGTFVNGKKLPSADLKDGDRLTLGQSKILVKIESGAAKPAAGPVTPPPRPSPRPEPPRPPVRPEAATQRPPQPRAEPR